MSFIKLYALTLFTPSLAFAGGVIGLPTCYIEDMPYKTIYKIEKKISSKNFSIERSKSALTDVKFYDNEPYHPFGSSDIREKDRVRRISKDIEKEEAPFEIKGPKEGNFTFRVDRITRSGSLKSIVENKKSKRLSMRLDRSLFEKETQIGLPSRISEKVYKISINQKSFELKVLSVKNKRHLKWYCEAGFIMESCGENCARFKPKFNSKMSQLVKKIKFRTNAKNTKCRVEASLFQIPNSRTFDQIDLSKFEDLMKLEIMHTVGRQGGSSKDAAFSIYNLFKGLKNGVKTVVVDCSGEK